jgi:ABC-type oligopeptide transport system substrate-binding subunit
MQFDTNVPDGGTFTDYAWLSNSGTNTSWDPGVVQSLAEAQITNAVFDGLTDFDFTQKCSPVLKGLVASSWDSNADASEFTFHIKSGLKFSNGESVLPSNFKKAWERAGSQEIASPYGYLIDYIKGGADLQAGKVHDLPAIVADDSAMTLKVTLSDPNADFPAIVSHSFFSPISNADLQKLGDKPPGWVGASIGNGPFMLDPAKAPTTEEVDLVPNPNWAGNVYGDKKAHLAHLIFKATDTVDTAWQTFTGGTGNDATIPPNGIKSAEATYKNNTVKDPNLGSYYFDIGDDIPELAGPKNRDLRIAISLSINRAEINTKVYEGARTISTGITPPGIPGFKAGLCDYCSYNPKLAKTYYDKWVKAGGKITKPIRISFNAGAGHEPVVQIIQSNLKDNLGLSTTLDPITKTYFRDIPKAGACMICRSGWYADYPTYGNFMVDLFSKASIDGNNFGRYDSPQFEAKIKAAQAETDKTKRGELYNQAEQILLNQDVQAIPINWYTGQIAYSNNVVNFHQPPLGLMLWEKVGVTS